MTLVLHAPTSPVNPAIPVNTLSEFLRSRMIEECKSTVIRVAEEAMQEITEALSAFGVPAQATPVVAAEAPVIQDEPAPAVPEVSKSETIQPKYKRGCHPNTKKVLQECSAYQANNAKYNVFPVMMKCDRDFGGTLEASEVCKEYQFSRKVYERYKKHTLIIRRCYRVFGGEMDHEQALKASGLSRSAFDSYVRNIKEGLNDPE